MKFSRNYLIAAAATAVLLIGSGVFAYSSAHKTVTPTTHKTANSVSESPSASASAVPASPTPSSSTKPSATPKSSPGVKSATKTATPTPRPAAPNCQGIHKGDDECVTKDLNRFQVTSANAWGTGLVCGPEQSVLTFNAGATRHYLAGGGGDSQVRINFSDGTSSLLTFHFDAYVAGIDSGTTSLNGLTHTFSNSIPRPYTYTMNILSPNVVNINYSTPFYVSCN